MRDKTKRQRTFSRRVFLLGGLKFSLLSLILGRFFYLQIYNSHKYLKLSENNITKIDLIPPKRGMIYDRNGIILADNYRTYSAVLKADSGDDIYNVVEKVETILKRKVAFTTQYYFQYKKLTKNNFKSDILIEENLTWLDISKLELAFIGLKYKGFEIKEYHKRRYLYPSLLSHILGYVSQPTIKDIDSFKIAVNKNFDIGRNGIEKTFDKELQGEASEKKFIVDAFGKKIKEISYYKGKEGKSLTLTLDVNIQQSIEQIMENRVGSVVLIKPHTGEIIALYSSPNYNSNLFTNGIKKQEWNNIILDQNKPMLNRAITALYAPGSTFKLVTALAILNAGISKDDTIFCTGKHKVGNRVFHCWKAGGHGKVNITQAIAKSCNIYFYIQSLKVGVERIAHMANLLGLGIRTNVNLPFESAGCIPNKNWKKRVIHKTWTQGDTVNTSIGQGYVLSTILQLAIMTSRIITGKKVNPILLSENDTDIARQKLDIKDEHRQVIMDGMRGVFDLQGGTGHTYHLNDIGIKLAGKTGTAQIVSNRKNTMKKFKEHGIFTGFVVSNTPEYVISAIVEHGGWGGSSALLIARELFLDLYRRKR